MKSKERQVTEELRLQGLSYNQIAEKVKVSKGTLSKWLSGIHLTHEQVETLKENCRVASILSGKKIRSVGMI